MKTLKRILLVIILFLATVLVNGIHYVFCGQDKSAAKLDAGKELNLYECYSIYTMHTAIWMFGWVISPEASEQAFLMLFPAKDRYRDNKNLYESTIVSKYTTQSKSVFHFRMNELTLREMRYALAINGGVYRNTPYNKEIVVDCSYGTRTDNFNFGIIEIKINYRLLSYIQDKNWIHKFKMIYTDPLFVPV